MVRRLYNFGLDSLGSNDFTITKLDQWKEQFRLHVIWSSSYTVMKLGFASLGSNYALTAIFGMCLSATTISPCYQRRMKLQ